MRRTLTAGTLLLGLCAPVQGGDLPLQLPLRCIPGKDCWVVNYPDADPGQGARDYACGHMTYDGHDGTDFAIRDTRAMEEGVTVVAAAAGVVRAVRDRMADVSVRAADAESLSGRECGNGVRIEHAGGWDTMYCHLKAGSVSVKPGESVQAGTRLGLVGLSGKTEFPHLHFTVRHRQTPVDPFVGLQGAPACELGAAPLWRSEVLAILPYTRAAIYNFGIAQEVPRAENARRGDYRSRTLAPSAPMLAVWADVWGVREGDIIRFEVDGPDGKVRMRGDAHVKRNQVRIFRALARERRLATWPVGAYKARIRAFDAQRRELGGVEFELRVVEDT